MRDKIDEALTALAAANPAPDRMRKAMVHVDSLVNLESGLGTSQDVAIHGRPTLDNRLTIVEAERAYLQIDLCRRIVEGLVDDALRAGFDVYPAGDEKKKGKPIEEPDHLDIVSAIRQAGYNERLYGGAAIALLYPDNSEKPLEDNAGEPTALLVLDRYEATVADYESDPTKPNFGLPSKWRVSPNNMAAAMLDAPMFHTSRLLKFTGAPLPSRLKTLNDGWGESILQACWTPIQNFVSAEQAIANIIQRFEVATYSLDGLADVLDDPDGAGDLLARMQLIQKTISMVNAVVVDKAAGEDYTRAFSSVNGLDTLWDRLAHSVAKAAQEPMTELFGMSPSGLATDDKSGRANRRKRVKIYQENKLTPLLERYFALIHGSPVRIVWHALDESTAQEEAEIEKIRAETREIYVAMGSAAPEEFRHAMEKEGLIEDAEDEAFDEPSDGMEMPEMDPEGGFTGDEIPAPREDDEEE
jgi:uncharacterized protein